MEFQNFSKFNEAFTPKKLKERDVKIFIKKCLHANQLESLGDLYDVIVDSSKDFTKEDIENLLKELEVKKPNNALEAGSIAMIQYYLQNYEKMQNDKSTLISLQQFKKLVEKGCDYKFRAYEISYTDINKDADDFPIDLFDLEELYDVKLKKCKFFRLIRDFKDRSELNEIVAIISDKGVYIKYFTDKVDGESDEFINVDKITEYIQNI